MDQCLPALHRSSQGLRTPSHPLSPSVVPEGTKWLLTPPGADTQGAAPSPTPTALVSDSTGGFLLPFMPHWLLEHETPPQHFHVLERAVSLLFRVFGCFNPRRAAPCRLHLLLPHQHEPAQRSCPILVMSAVGNPVLLRPGGRKRDKVGGKWCLQCPTSTVATDLVV